MNASWLQISNILIVFIGFDPSWKDDKTEIQCLEFSSVEIYIGRVTKKNVYFIFDGTQCVLMFSLNRQCCK